MITSPAGVVAIVEDDEAMRNALRRVLETEGFVTEVFGTAEACLANDAAARAGCMVLDIQLPGMSGIDLRRHLLLAGRSIPTVFVTAYEDVRMRDLLVKATDCCLVKPFAADALIHAVHRSIAR
jgi:FixJ family two-component response regulator